MAEAAAGTRRIALIQFDARPEQVEANLGRVLELTREAAGGGARWVVFHEGTLSDYTPRLEDLAEAVPDGPSTDAIAATAAACGCFVSFGLSERAQSRGKAAHYYISQVFVGPDGYIHHYRKTWLWRDEPDTGYRNEWARYDPGTGPGLFELDGVCCTCFICADGGAPRCLERAAHLEPDLVFYPNNRAQLPDFPIFGEYARQIGAPMLVTNRVGASWEHDCAGGCAVFDATGQVLAAANREAREEVLLVDLDIPERPHRAAP